jgi:hypothetical protein
MLSPCRERVTCQCSSSWLSSTRRSDSREVRLDFVGVVDGQQTCSCRLGKKFTDVRSTMSVDAVNASSLCCCIYPLNWRQVKRKIGTATAITPVGSTMPHAPILHPREACRRFRRPVGPHNSPANGTGRHSTDNTRPTHLQRFRARTRRFRRVSSGWGSYARPYGPEGSVASTRTRCPWMGANRESGSRLPQIGCVSISSRPSPGRSA